MTIQEVFKLYKLESWNFVDIPDRGIPFLAKYEIDKNEIESSLLNSFEFIDLILEDNEDKFFIFQILACTTNFPKKYLNNILELILMIENNHSQVLFHLQRNFGFLIIEDWFQEKFNLS